MKAILLRCFPSFFSCYGDTARKLSVCESDVSVNSSNTVPLFDASVTFSIADVGRRSSSVLALYLNSV